MPALPNARLSRAVLIGTSEFRGSADLMDLPAVRNNLIDLRASLTHPERGILAKDNCRTVNNPRTLHEFMSQLRQCVRQVDDFLLVYYAGHGVRHATKDTLYLTLRDTDTEVLNGTAVPLDWVKEEIEQSPARTRLLVLDCCYSGLAVATMSAAIEQRELEVRGSAVIASSPRNAKSHSPAGRRHTAFTGQLVKLLENGSPNADEQLTVMALFRRLDAALAYEGFPKPMISASGTTGELLLRREPLPQVIPIESPLRRLTPVPPPSEPPTPLARPLTPVPPPQRLSPPTRQLTPVPPPGMYPLPAQPGLPAPLPLASPSPSASPPRRDAAFWARLIVLRLLWVGFALMLLMFLASLFGVLFAEPRAPAEGSTAVVGLCMSAAFGVPLYLLDRRWRQLNQQVRFARSAVGRVVLAIAGGICLIFCTTALFADYTSGQVSSEAGTQAASFLLGLEGAAACGYHLHRGRRTPS